MARGGNRPGAGRPKGSTNLRSLTDMEAIIATGVTPLEYLTSVYQDANADEARRLTAAVAAAPYVHAKLSSVEMTGKDGGPVETVQKIQLVGPDDNTAD